MNLIEANRDPLMTRVDLETSRWVREQAKRADQSVNHFLWRLLQRVKQEEELKEFCWDDKEEETI